ncbi:predicted protein [Chaetoceros tenuissimus]|uniref:Uncharacterized protein n=1 Tax=Chaetoceros tenuissimus TaxID=426638 RepID=A0AAD3GZF6_9STRA|nr:predicted protein [Chaetoceros tenuissimus]
MIPNILVRRSRLLSSTCHTGNLARQFLQQSPDMNCNRIMTQLNPSRKFYSRTTNASSSTERLVEIRDTAAITSFVASFGFFFYYLAEKLEIDADKDLKIMKKMRFGQDFEENNKRYIDDFIEESQRSYKEATARKANSDVVDENIQRKFGVNTNQLYMELFDNAMQSFTGDKLPSSNDEAFSTLLQQQKSVMCAWEQDKTEYKNKPVLQLYIPSSVQRKMFDAIKVGDFKILYKILNDINVREAESPKSKDKKQLLQQLGNATKANEEIREEVRRCLRLVFVDCVARVLYTLRDPSKKRELAELCLQTGKFWQEEGFGGTAMYFYRDAKNALTPEYEKDPLMTEIVRCMASLFMDNGQVLRAYSALCHAEKIASENSDEQLFIRMDKNRVFLETIMNNTLKVDHDWYDEAWKEANETKQKLDASGFALKHPKEYKHALANMGRMAFVRAYKMFRRSELPLAQQYFNEALRKEVCDDSFSTVKNDTPQQALQTLENMPKSLPLAKEYFNQKDICDGSFGIVNECTPEQILHALEKMPTSAIETNRDLAEIIFGLSEVYWIQGKKKIARRYLDLALPAMELTYGKHNPKLLDIYQRAAYIYRDSLVKSVLVDDTKMKECCDKAIAMLVSCECSDSGWEMKKELFQEMKKSFSLKLTI